MPEALSKVFFDTNEATDDGKHCILWLDQSIKDLAKIAGGPKEGMVVVVYMLGEVEMEATLIRNDSLNAWTGKYHTGTLRNNYETEFL